MSEVVQHQTCHTRSARRAQLRTRRAPWVPLPLRDEKRWQRSSLTVSARNVPDRSARRTQAAGERFDAGVRVAATQQAEPWQAPRARPLQRRGSARALVDAGRGYMACRQARRAVGWVHSRRPASENGVTVPSPKDASSAPRSNVAGMLWDVAERYTRRAAILYGSATTDYGKLRDRAAAVARTLSEQGVRPGDRVGIFLDAGADAVAAFFGVTAVGGIAIVINESLRPRQVEYMLRHGGAVLLITSTGLLDRQPRPLETACRILDVGAIPAASAFGPTSRHGMDPAQITYTSGSTGPPKGVIISHANLWAAMEAVTSYLGIVTEDRIASVLPFSFVYGMSQVLCTVGTGATLVIERSPLMQQLVLSLHARETSVLAAVPPLWLQLLHVPAFQTALSSLRIMTNAGGHLPVPAVRGLRQTQPQAKLYLMYGLTEVLRSTFLSPDEVNRRPDSIGRAIPGAEVLVVRDDLTLCGPGEVGELVHCGPTVTLGYWNDPEATARVFRPHPLRARGASDDERVVFSGDLVRRDAEGYLYFVGRRDRLIKTLGYRVSPEEITNVVYASGEILEGVVTSELDELRGERIVACVVLAEGGSLERLKDFCGRELPYYMRPARFDVRNALPRLPSGKHDLAAVRGGRNLS